MADLDATFSLPAAQKPPAQKIGHSGWDSKIFGMDDSAPMPPAPKVEQLLSRPFAPQMLRFYLGKRAAERQGADGQGREVWRYTLHGKTHEVKLPLPSDAPQVEQVAVDAIARVEGTSDAQVRLAVAQVCTANWPEFLGGAAGEPPAPGLQPGIPAFLQRLLAQTPTVRQAPPPDLPLPAPVAERECEDSQAGKRCKADFFLREAGGLLSARGREYDRITGAAGDAPELEERSIARTVAAFNAIHHTRLTAAQGWHFMALLKQVRLFTAPGFHRDSAADGVAYMALLAEEKSMEA